MKVIKIIFEIFNDMLNYCERNILKWFRMIILLLPYVMYFIGIGKIEMNTILILPASLYFAYAVLNKAGSKSTMPVPEKRFTEREHDGASIDRDRLNELIWYMTDFEDWLEDNWWKR